MLFKISQSLRFLRNIVIAAGLSVTAVCAQPVVTPPPFVTTTTGGGSGVVFVPPTIGGVQDPIHYINLASNGASDSNDGLSPTVGGGHGPWLSPNHQMNCGDPIVVVPNTYPSGFNIGAITLDPANCPSTTGGIDGNGGINFAIVLCGGTDLESCKITGSQAHGAFEVGWANGASTGTFGRWAVEGFHIDLGGTTVGSVGNHAFESLGCGVNRDKLVHHVAFINNFASNSGDGFNIGDCGSPQTVPGNGVDHFYVVGGLAQNATLDSICLGAIDDAGAVNTDSIYNTHMYFYGNFSFSNPICNNDGEGFLIDTPNAHAGTGIFVIANNVGWNSGRMGFALEYGSGTGNPITPEPTYRIYNNTFYNNNVSNINCGGTQGEINTYNNTPYTMVVQNNIGSQDAKQFCDTPLGASGGYNYAFVNQVNSGGNTVGGTGKENIWHGIAGACGCANGCDAAFDAVTCNGTTSNLGPGPNISTNPTFRNGSDLLTNHLGTPNCTGFDTVTKCMGYDPTTSTLTVNSPIYDLVATCASCSGKGYQLPSFTCITSSSPFYADFPADLKGIVRLKYHAATQTITRELDLVSVPCGL